MTEFTRALLVLVLAVSLLRSAAGSAQVRTPLSSGAVLRIAIFHDDGFGDFQNAVTLSHLLRTLWPDARFPVVIESPRVFDRFLGSNASSAGLERHVFRGVEFIRGETDLARRELSASESQIVLLPAGNERTSMVWGTGRYTLYVEEPGAPASEMAYVALPRGKVIRRSDGSRHLRLNPGFGTFSHGLARPPSPPAGAPASREALLAALGTRNVAVDPTFKSARWGAAYSHAQYGNNSHVYLEAIAFSLRFQSLDEHVVVFDFGRGTSSREYLDRILNGKRKFWQSKIPLRLVDAGGPPVSPIGPKVKRSLTVVRVGASAHDDYLDFVRQADLPVAVTGTNSLLEAIDLDLPFVHEFIAWKMDLNFGMAQVILENFAGEEREFLLDWILGAGDDVRTPEDLERARESFQTAPVTRDEKQMSRHRWAAYELMTLPRRRESVRKTMALLRSRFDLGSRLAECASLLTESEPSSNSPRSI